LMKGTSLAKDLEEVKFAYASMDRNELIDSPHGDDSGLAQAMAAVAAKKALASAKPIEKPKKDKRYANWGGLPYAPIYPTDRQLVSRLDSLYQEQHEIRTKRSADIPRSLAERREAAKAFQTATDERRKQKLDRQKAAASAAARQESSSIMENISAVTVPADQFAGGTQPWPARTPGLQLLPGDGARSFPSYLDVASGGHRSKRRHDPAKIYNEDGSFRLRGVRSTSDIARFTSGITPHTRHSWEVRGAYKLMRAEQHSATVNKTWEALQSWCASDRSFDQWYSDAKKGVKYERHL
jgi:hypothetical protein